MRPICATQSSKKHDCVLSHMGMTLLGATVLETEWNGTANPPRPQSAPPPHSPPFPLNQEWSRAKEKTQTRHIDILDMGGRGWGLNFPPWVLSKIAYLKTLDAGYVKWRRVASEIYQTPLISTLITLKLVKDKRIFMYLWLIRGDSWILSSLSLTCKIKKLMHPCYLHATCSTA